jgi:hypothetical protein
MTLLAPASVGSPLKPFLQPLRTLHISSWAGSSEAVGVDNPLTSCSSFGHWHILCIESATSRTTRLAHANRRGTRHDFLP